MTAQDLKEAFEHCEPGRWEMFCRMVRARAARPDRDFRKEVSMLLFAMDEGTRLYMARVKGGFTDEE